MIVPVTHRILIKADRIENVDKTYIAAKRAGIVIPDHDDNKRAQAGVDKGIVVAIGPTAFRDFNTECPLSVGDYVAYARYSGKHIEDPDTGEEFIVLNDEDVVVYFKKEEAING